jgi:hypothetical protein
VQLVGNGGYLLALPFNQGGNRLLYRRTIHKLSPLILMRITLQFGCFVKVFIAITLVFCYVSWRKINSSKEQ